MHGTPHGLLGGRRAGGPAPAQPIQQQAGGRGLAPEHPPTSAVITEKDMALGLLQTAVAQLLPQPPVSIPAEELLNQLLEVQDSLQERPQLPYRWVSCPSPAPLFPEVLPHIQPPACPGVPRGGPGRRPEPGLPVPAPEEEAPGATCWLRDLLCQSRLQRPAVQDMGGGSDLCHL